MARTVKRTQVFRPAAPPCQSIGPLVGGLDTRVSMSFFPAYFPLYKALQA